MRSVANRITDILKDKCPDLTNKISAVYQTPKGILQPVYFTATKKTVSAGSKEPHQFPVKVNVFH